MNPCDHNFFLEFDNTTHEHYDEEYHLTTLKRGEYCKFCKGTFARATQGLQEHDFSESIDAQIGNNRFYVAETCDDCGYETNWWYVVKDTPFDLNSLKAKRRYEINKGIKNFEVIDIDPKNYSEDSCFYGKQDR